MGHIVQGLLAAHSVGLAHGELGAEFVIWDEKEHTLKLYGLRRAEGDDLEAMQRRDLVAVGDLLELIAPFLVIGPELLKHANSMRSQPSADRCKRASALLVRE